MSTNFFITNNQCANKNRHMFSLGLNKILVFGFRIFKPISMMMYKSCVRLLIRSKWVTQVEVSEKNGGGGGHS